MGIERKLKRDGDFSRQKLQRTKARRNRLATEREIAEQRVNRPRNDLLPRLNLEMVATGDLRPASRRVRKADPEQLARVVAAIADFGFRQPIVARHGVIFDGHLRWEAAKHLRLERVPVINCDDLSEAEARRLRLSINRLGELGEWDLEQLKIEFEELIDLDADVMNLGFDSKTVDIILLDDDHEESKAKDVPEPPAVPVSRIGDLWMLGDHRVICGNSLEQSTYVQLLAGAAVHAVLSDPPYNVKIKGNVSSQDNFEEFAMASGEMNGAEWQAFLDAVLALLASHCVSGAVLFLFMDWRSIHCLYQAGFAAGLNLINLVVWYKESGSMGSLYRSSHELVAVFCRGDKIRRNHVELGRHGRDRQNTWVAPGANRPGSSANLMLKSHATPKPVELCVDAILDVTDPGDTVLDAFLGSGTTLIAAEKTGRRCCGIEIDPKFVDVIVRRWQDFTGEEAVLSETDETFEAVAGRRLDEADILGGDDQGENA